MDYKKIIKGRELRLAILKALSFVPDKQMVRLQYKIKTGRKLSLTNPKRYTEKLQWYKLNYKNPLMIPCVDKFDVRAFVESKGMSHILNECYGVFDQVEDIDFEALPNQFVLKDTLGGGGHSVILIKNKAEMDLTTVKAQLQKWVGENHRVKSGGREWPYYSGKKHRIIIEKYIESDQEQGGLIDYKFFCFDGKCELIYVMGDRAVGQSVKVSLFDRNFNKLPVERVGDEEFVDAPKPDTFQQMLEVAERLAADFPHVRVDLYSIKNKVLFGELTFYNASGYMMFKPDEFDFELGNQFVLPT